ncbi:hypothetical protein HCC30_09670 [Streptomyces sp. HNM0574]|nr:tetratricopeptide repeat protein [Streptomyces sp. HNM0574]NLU67534.1 hypothetical protein [Streptomyces sp. HNM0574]
MGGNARAETVLQAGTIENFHHNTYVQSACAHPPAGHLLPAETGLFVNRGPERERVRRALAARAEQADGAVAEAGGPVRPLVVALTGVGGMGKSTLGVRLGHEAHALCPDGSLYADLGALRRETDGAVDVGEVLHGLLEALGVEAGWVRPGLAERASQFRQLTAGKRLVLVLDNVRYADEITPLLPASAGSVVLVISHQRLAELECDEELPLGPLSTRHAVELLRGIVKDARRGVDDDSYAEVAELCEGLPEALRVAGSRMRQHRRRRFERLLAELRSELDREGLPVVEAVWNTAYRELSADAALLYRLLPVVPGPHVSPAAAAALLGAGEDRAADALDELEDAGLLEDAASDGADLLRMPDLLRSHARRCRRALPDGGEAETGEATRRLVRWYRRQAERADRAQQQKRMRFAEPVPPLPYAPDLEFAGGGEAGRWLEAERHALHGCVRLAYEAGEDEDAWALCEPLWLQFVDHRHFGESFDSFGTGLAAAGRAGDLPAQVRMRCQLARVLWELGDLEDADKTLEPALHASALLLEGAGEPRPELRKLRASTLEFSGNYWAARKKWARAADSFRASREIHEEIGNPYGVLLQTHLLGRATAALGKLEEAAGLLETAHAMAAEQDRDRMTARTAFELGRVRERQGSANRAARLYELALESALRRGASFEEAEVRRALAGLAESSGDTATAERHRAVVRAYEERAGIVRRAGEGE